MISGQKTLVVSSGALTLLRVFCVVGVYAPVVLIFPIMNAPVDVVDVVSCVALFNIEEEEDVKNINISLGFRTAYMSHKWKLVRGQSLSYSYFSSD